MILEWNVKFMFSKKATKIDEIFTVDVVNVKSTLKISSFFVTFLENMNFTIVNKIFLLHRRGPLTFINIKEMTLFEIFISVVKYSRDFSVRTIYICTLGAATVWKDLNAWAEAYECLKA